jgi:hypothetical protein
LGLISSNRHESEHAREPALGSRSAIPHRLMSFFIGQIFAYRHGFCGDLLSPRGTE